ncbi:MAG TPA: protein translocase subunit SecF [Patescibacteria group bacterium]|nr:protein translocase subunit SecF [Patescibacteria group bacterium]
MINFLKYKFFYFIISGIVLVVGIFSLVRYGFVFSLDFTGGGIVEYSFDKKISRDVIQKTTQTEGIKIVSIEETGENRYLLKTAPIDEKKEETLRKKIQDAHKVRIETLRFETVGPTMGKETAQKTIIAAIVAIIGIFLYLTISFSRFTYGLAAIVALIHDFLIVLGTYSLLSRFLDAEFDTLFVTAILTTMSFSVHDTIVVFDKIREHTKIETTTPFSHLANKAVTETMVRSLNNSLTIILMLLALILLGGLSIKFFVATLLIGTITGTYSSPFIAVPVLEMMEGKKKRK